MNAQKPLAALLFSLSLVPALFAQVQDNWQIDNVHLPSPPPPGLTSSWWGAMPLGPVLDNGRNQYLLRGAEFKIGLDFPRYSITDGAGRPTAQFKLTSDTEFTLDGIWWDPKFALLKTPTGFQAALLQGARTLAFFDLGTGRFSGGLKPPPPQLGLPIQLTWAAFWNAGDINLDGYDDIFFQDTAVDETGYCGLIDGASRLVSWRAHNNFNSDLFPIERNPSTGFSDFNGDSVPDFVAGNRIAAVPQAGPFFRQIIAYSGTDGAVIWETQIPNPGIDAGAVGFDINADGFPEIYSHGGQSMYCLDGASGAIIWQTSIQDLATLVGAGVNDLVFANPVFLPTVDGANFAHEVFTAFTKEGTSPPYFRELFLGTFDPINGSVLTAHAMPSNLLPWVNEQILPDNSFTFSNLGDIDNDGLTEIARTVDTPSLDPLGFGPNTVASIAILGAPTIEVPNSLSQTQVNQIRVSIPSAKFLPATLLLSSGFQTSSDFVIDGWHTSLSRDRMLDWSLAQVWSSQNLDQNGEGTFSVSLPGNPNLIGVEIFARVVVRDPSAPLSKVWTISSLGQGTIVP